MTSEPSALTIVVADGLTTNPGDLDWSALAECGELRVYDRCGPLLVERCQDAQVVFTNKERFDAEVLAKLPKLRLLSVLATGTNVVDLEAAASRGVTVCNVPGYSTHSVAQQTFALLLELSNRTSNHHRAAANGEWTRSGQFSYSLGPIGELAGKTLGIIGLGKIGQTVAKIGAAFGMRIAAAEHRSRRARSDVPYDVEWLPLTELFTRSDVVSLHCPLREETQSLINTERLAQMKRSAFLINTGRGALISEPALLHALQHGEIAGAGLDVLCEEPPPADAPLLRYAANPAANGGRLVLSPHIGWATFEARQRLLNVSLENLRAFLASAPQNVVNAT